MVTKKCWSCGMDIPILATKCPYCRTSCEEGGDIAWLIRTRFDLNLFLGVFSICTLMLLFGISIFCVDNEVYQNFLRTYLPTSQDLLGDPDINKWGISLCVMMGFTELWLVISVIKSLFVEKRESNMTPSLSIIVFIICLVSGIGYAIYEFDKRSEILIEVEKDSGYSRGWSPYNGTLSSFSINEYSYRFNKTDLAVTIHDDGAIYFTLLNKWHNNANIQWIDRDCYVRLGDNDNWKRLSNCKERLYYFGGLYEDVIRAGKFCVKVPTNIGYLEYKFEKKNYDDL